MKAPLQSVYLTRLPVPDERDFSRVLVVGTGPLANETARSLAAEGYQIVRAIAQEGVDCEGAILQEVRGSAGAYEVELRNGHQHTTEHVGFVVAADQAQLVPKFEKYGLSASNRVIGLSAFETLLSEGGALPAADRPWLHIVFLCGLAGESDPATFSRVFDAIELLHSREHVQTYVFTRNIKVAADDLERHYRKARDAGTLFFKFDGPGPIFEQDGDRPVLVFSDPLLGLEMELAADVLVVDEHQGPPVLEQLLKIIPSATAMQPFLQPESTRFSGLQTPKAGTYAIGPSRGSFTRDAAARDLNALPTELAAMVRDQSKGQIPAPPDIDQARCTICLTCVRLCPHGAITFRKRAEVDPMSCMRCGICAAECPEKAIRTSPHPKADNGKDNFAAALSSGVSDKIVAFLCSRSAAQALSAMTESALASVVPMVVQCAGSVDVENILTAFQSGAVGVLIAGCHRGNCASIYGTVLAGERSNRAAAMLAEAGLDPRRVLFVPMAANAPQDLIHAVEHPNKVGRSSSPSQ